MSQPDRPTIRLHEDADLFREAVNFTAAETSFPARLIEKDYFCALRRGGGSRRANSLGDSSGAKPFTVVGGSPAMKRREFIRHLIDCGCFLVREGNSHSIYVIGKTEFMV